MAALPQTQNRSDLFDAYFRKADLDGDGQISGAEAVAFFQGSNLPKHVLAQVWMYADQKNLGYLNRPEFYNALKLVTVAQSKRELTPDIVKAALYSPASDKIPAPQINIANAPATQSRTAAAIPQSTVSASGSAQNFGVRGPPTLGHAGLNQQVFQPQQNQFIRPPQATPTSTSSQMQQAPAAHVLSQGSMVATRPPSSNVSTKGLGGSISGSFVGVSAATANQGMSPVNQDGFGVTSSVQSSMQVMGGQMPSTAPKPQDSFIQSNQTATKDPKALAVSGNGFASNSLFGDVFSARPAQPKQTSLTVASSVSTAAVSMETISAAEFQSSAKTNQVESPQTTFPKPPLSGEQQQGPVTGKQNHQVPAPGATTSISAGFSDEAGNLASNQSTKSQHPWPKMTQSDVQKYTKVFVQVDTDRDGKITGEQARNLFLSWRLPREILKQVWDLADQDNDSMLSLREFCIALHLMERYREGRPLPSVLPSTITSDDILLSISGQPTPPYGNAAWGPSHGFQQPQVMNASRPPLPSARGRPPRPVPVSLTDANMPAPPQKPKVPVLEKHLVDQLSQEEQDSLDTKFKETTEANKKVEELEKEIQDSKAKIEFCRSKMQELILYKSRCDNRLNEITERVSADKREVEALARKYEEKYKQAGDVASRLTIEEATFRDIQEKKLELYQAIVKIEQGDATGSAFEDRANNIQSGLEELVKNVNERCKQYGLRARPTSLVELPFGWQPGILEGAADWDENWDKLEDEGFTLVKELTLDIQNVTASPKPKSSLKEIAAANEIASAASRISDANSENISRNGKPVPEKDMANDHNKDDLAKSPKSPAENGAVENQPKDFQDFKFQGSVGLDGAPHAVSTTVFDGSPHAKETLSDQVGGNSIFSGDKNFDERGWGTFDSQYDTESAWGFDNESHKDGNHGRSDSNSLFGLGEFNIKPIRTQPSNADNMFHGNSPFNFDSVPSTPAYGDNTFQGKSSSIFSDSVPSTPAYTDNTFKGRNTSIFADSVPSTPAYADNTYKGGNSSVFADSVPSTPAYADNMFKGRNSSVFADSVPSTPAYADNLFKGQSSSFFSDSVPSTPSHNFGNSLGRFGEGSEEHSFDSFSRFDSFRMPDSGPFQAPSLARFDSVRSSADFDQGHGFPSRFDSFNSRDGHDGGAFQSPRHSLARFDSMRSTSDFDHSHNFPSFDDTDPFGSSGPFKTSLESQTPRKDSDHWSAF